MRRIGLVLGIAAACAACGGVPAAEAPTTAASPSAGVAPVAQASATTTTAVLTQTKAATEGAESARLHLVTTISGGLTPEPVSFVADGETAFGEPRAHITLDLGGLGATAGLPSGSFLEEIIDGTTLYLRSPMLAFAAPTPWISMDLNALAAESGVDPALLQQQFGAQTNPADFLAVLEAAGEVTLVGDEEVRGEPTSHYHAVVDLTALAEAEGTDSASLGGLIAQGGLSETMPIDVWIGADGLTRRILMEQTSVAGTYTIDMELYDFGVDFELPIPAASEVTAITDLSAFGGVPAG